MTGHTELAITPRDRYLAAAQKELIAFEQREREFLKKDREERAAELQQLRPNQAEAHNWMAAGSAVADRRAHADQVLGRSPA